MHNDGDLDPIRDIETILEELRLKDLQQIEGIIPKIEVAMRGSKDKKKELEELALITKVTDLLKDHKMIKDEHWSSSEVILLNKHLFLTSKPMIYLVNIGDTQYVKKQNPWLPKLQAYIKEHGGGSPMIPYSASFESEVVAASPDDKEIQAAKAKELGGVSMIDRIIKSGYKNLQLIHFFTAGEDEVKCWTIRDGAKAPNAAGTIHTDFERGFICAEVMKFSDLEEHGSEQ